MKTRAFSVMGVAILLALAGCGDDSDSRSAKRDASAAEAQTAGSEASNSAPTVSVHVETVARRQLQGWIYSQGTARSRQREFLTFTQQGVVSHVDENLRVGVPVRKGQVIAHQAPERVTADYQAAKAALAEAQASLALANVTLRRYQTLIEQRSASRQELDQAQVQLQQAKAVRDNAKAQLAQAQLGVDESRLVSPIDGVLARLNIEKGRYFMPSTVQTGSEQSALRTVPALVIDPHRFEVRVDLPAYDFRQVKTGARAVIGENPSVAGQFVDPTTNARQVHGRVYAISPSLDPEARTFEVLVHTEGDDPGLQDGGFVAVWIAEQKLEDALVVPLEALRFRNDQSFVFVLNADAKVSERRVELGQQAGAYRAVIDGLEAGEQVVTDGRAALYDGQRVRVLPAAGPRP